MEVRTAKGLGSYSKNNMQSAEVAEKKIGVCKNWGVQTVANGTKNPNCLAKSNVQPTSNLA